MNSGGPSVSVIIPTYNEETTVEPLLRQLTEFRPLEIIVADGQSSDRTSEIARRYAVVLQSAPSRALQMNAAAQASNGDVLLFLHADVRLEPSALSAMRRVMSDPSVAGGNFDICYEGSDMAARVFTKVNRIRCRWGVFYGDSGIFCRRDVFDSLGGFPPWPIMEDYDFARRLRKAGRLALLDEAIYVSSRRWRKGGLFATLFSWTLIQGLYSLGVSPHRLARFYRNVR